MLYSRVGCLPINNTISWKGLARTNTQAYYEKPYKSFITLAHGVTVLKKSSLMARQTKLVFVLDSKIIDLPQKLAPSKHILPYLVTTIRANLQVLYMLLAQRLNVIKLTIGKARSFFQVSLFSANAEDIQYIVKRRSGLAHIVINERISDGKKHRQMGLFHPVNSLGITRNLWLNLLSKI
jgi:hypothetical protein